MRNRPRTTRQGGIRSVRAQMEFARALQAFEAGDWTAAGEICRQLLKKNEKDVHALQLRGRLRAQSGHDDQATSYYNPEPEIPAEGSGGPFSPGRPRSGTGQSPACGGATEQALCFKPTFNAALIQKAAVLERIGHYDEARELLPDLSVRGKDAGYLARPGLRLGPLEELVAGFRPTSYHPSTHSTVC